jgi:hypothetical protein
MSYRKPGARESLSAGRIAGLFQSAIEARLLMRRSKFVLTSVPYSLKCDDGAVHKLSAWVVAGLENRTGYTVSLV